MTAKSPLAQRLRRLVTAVSEQGENRSQLPREVYGEVCASLARRFECDGFVYAASKHHLTRTVGEFTHRVAFQTSHYNVRGALVKLRLFGNVRSIPLRKWRQTQPAPFRRDDVVAGGSVDSLDETRSHSHWNLAGRRERAEAIVQIEALTRAVILPYFELFRDARAVVQRFARDGLPLGIEVGDAVELALRFSSRDAAEAVLSAFVSSRPGLSEAVAESAERFRRDGLPKHVVSKYAEQVAWLQIAYQLRWQAA